MAGSLVVSADQQVASQSQMELEAILKQPYQDVCHVCSGAGKTSPVVSCSACGGTGNRYLKLL